MYIESMKTQPIDYNKLYAQARKLFFDTRQSYNLLDRKTESLAYLIALETGLRVSDLLKLKYNEINFNNQPVSINIMYKSIWFWSSNRCLDSR